MNDFRFTDALRYGLPGGVLLLVAAAAYPELRRAVRVDGGVLEATLIAGAALVVGSVIQALHRALVYPAIYRWFLVKYEECRDPTCTDLKSSYMPSATEITVIELRWDHAAKNPQIANRLANWGSETHFLYAAMWAVLGGLVLPAFAGFDFKPRGAVIVLVLGMFLGLGVGAFIHDRRLMLIDKALTRGVQKHGKAPR